MLNCGNTQMGQRARYEWNRMIVESRRELAVWAESIPVEMWMCSLLADYQRTWRLDVIFSWFSGATDTLRTLLSFSSPDTILYLLLNSQEVYIFKKLDLFNV